MASGGTGPGRREARERALEVLYEAAAKSCSPSQILADLPVEPDPYACDLIAGVDSEAEEIDEIIARFSAGWAIDRMPLVDAAVLRLAVYELARRPDVPTAVVLSEAVELAKRYSTSDSGRFVNGVLASVAAELRQ